MNFKAILGYATSVVGAIGSHAAGLPWWMSIVTAVVGNVATHYAPQPGQNQ